MRKRSLSLSACVLLLATWSVPLAFGKGLNNRNGIKQVLLISIDGFHALDYLNCSNGISTINHGQPYCPSLAALGISGINYLQTSASTPSDSFPGLTALVTGGTPRVTGVNYAERLPRERYRPGKQCAAQRVRRIEFESAILTIILRRAEDIRFTIV